MRLSFVSLERASCAALPSYGSRVGLSRPARGTQWARSLIQLSVSSSAPCACSRCARSQHVETKEPVTTCESSGSETDIRRTLAATPTTKLRERHDFREGTLFGALGAPRGSDPARDRKRRVLCAQGLAARALIGSTAPWIVARPAHSREHARAVKSSSKSSFEQVLLRASPPSSKSSFEQVLLRASPPSSKPPSSKPPSSKPPSSKPPSSKPPSSKPPSSKPPSSKPPSSKPTFEQATSSKPRIIRAREIIRE